MNLSTRSVASSTVLPITLISVSFDSSVGRDCTVTPGVRVAAPGSGFEALGFSPEMPMISLRGMRIRRGPASTSAIRPAEDDRLLEIFHVDAHAGRKLIGLNRLWLSCGRNA